MSKIYEKDHTGQIRSRKSGDYGNERIEHPTTDDIIAYNQKESMAKEMDKVINPVRKQVRAEVLDELWAADKLNKDGYWYIKLSDAIKIIGE